MSEASPAEGTVPRRQALCGILALGVLGPAALAACSSTTKEYGSAPGPAKQQPKPGGPLAKVADVPVGSGKVVMTPDGKPVVIIQPAPGEFRAYSAACTHQGVTVGDPKGGVATCPQHNSKFDMKDGSVISGPAQSPLPEVSVKVQGDGVVLA
jgi:nitrite reductase/ring-hydroxylating ferredoxin subunit